MPTSAFTISNPLRHYAKQIHNIVSRHEIGTPAQRLEALGIKPPIGYDLYVNFTGFFSNKQSIFRSFSVVFGLFEWA